MATKRFGYLDDLSLKGQKVGIGTSTANEKLEVLGGTRGGDVVVTGIATLTSYEGFQNKKTSYVENIYVDSGESGSLSEVVIGSGTTLSVGTGATTGQGNIKSLKVSNTFIPPIGSSDERPSAPQQGALFYNKDFRTIEYWDGNFWRQVDNITRRGRGIHAGGATPVPANSYTGFISAFEMATLGDAINFGDLLKPGQGHSGCSSSTRGLFGGRKTPSGNPDDDIEYLTIASGGQTIFFGNMSSGRRLGAAFSSSTRGLWACGITPSRVNVIDYVEISTLGDSIDFGDAMNITATMCGCSSPTRGIFCSGRITSPATLWMSRVEEVTIASKGNSTKFGDLTVAPASGASFSNSVRGFFAGGHTNPNYDSIVPGPIDYMTFATGGNAVRFGDLPSLRTSTSGCASQTRGFVMGGYGVESPAITNAIDYITIASAGNSMDFGDLVRPLESGGALSDSHGGLGGF